MVNPRALFVIACAGALVACGGSGDTQEAGADISRISEVKAGFGPEFQVSDIATTGIDPKLLAAQEMPAGLTFAPEHCGSVAEDRVLPEGLQGNMAATSAEGEGNRFIALAVETSEAVPFQDPGEDCRKVEFSSPQMRGVVEVVEAPQIEGVQTQATHRVLQTVVGGVPRTGELYNYVAAFDDYLVIVSANPLVVPDQPVVPVDTERARNLLTSAVEAVRG